MFKKITAFIIAITIILVNTNNVNAGLLDIGTVITGLNGSFNLADSNEKKRSDLSNWVNQNSTWAGFMFDTALTSNYLTPSLVYSVLPQSVKDTISDSTDESEILNKTIDMILEGQSVSGNDITNNTNVNTFIKNISNQYVNSNVSIVYTFDTSGSNLNAFANINQMNNALKKMREFALSRPDGIWCIQRPNSGNTYLGFVDTRLHPYLVMRNPTSSDSDDLNGTLVNCNLWDGENNSWFTEYDFTYVWNTIDGETDWHDSSYSWASGTTRCCSLFENGSIYSTASGSRPNGVFMTYGKCQAIRYFAYTDSIGVNEILYSPYYYNNSVWNDFSSSSGDYTFNPTNINTVTYGDTTSYITDYYDENQNPPIMPQINNYITQQNEQNVNSGGGSGSGGDSGSDSPSDIFGWLKQLGAVLSSLIKGVGEFLTEIVSGLVSAITDLLESLSGLVTGVLESLTNIFSGLISFLFDGLPDEVKSVLTLGLTVALLITVIKLIRGN